MKNKKHLLFVSHESTRTGAPILLINLAELLVGTGKYSIRFLIRRYDDQALLERFKAVGETFVAEFPAKSVRSKISKVVRSSHFSSSELRKAARNADLILNNTITNGSLLPELRKYTQAPIVSYIHELPIAAATNTKSVHVNATIRLSQFFLVPSNSVRTFLLDLLVSEDKIGFLPYYIHLNAEKSGAHEGIVTVGSCGSLNWRKAPDIFLCVAQIFFSRYPEKQLMFKWKGGKKDSKEWLIFVEDIKKAGLQDRVVLLESDDRMEDFFQSIDIFLLPSKEDPYPLVMLEAALYGKPTLCFRSSGGAEEFVDDGAGFSVPYLNVLEMADKLYHLLDHPSMLAEAGERARRKVLQVNKNTEHITSAFEDLIQQIVL